MTKKRFLLALALMLTAVGGAWAQNTVTWTQADLSGINLVSGQSTTINGVTLTANNGSVYIDGAGALFFNGNNNEGFTFSVAEGSITQIVITASMFNVSAAGWTVDGTETQATWTGNAQSVNFGTAVLDVSSIEFTIETAPGTLVEDGNNHWHLTTPAGNVTLTVTYYGQYRLDSIPQGWQVKVNGSLMGSDTLKTYEGGNPQMRYIAAINETDSVELIPPADVKPNVKSVTLVEPVTLQTISIGGLELDITDCTTWEEVVARNTAVIKCPGNHVKRVDNDQSLCYASSGSPVQKTTTLDTDADYIWQYAE